MQGNFFNVKDFKDIPINLSEVRASAESLILDAAGPQKTYDVFLSHSTDDAKLIKQIRAYLETKHDLSVYIDWDEDCGTSRDEIASVVKKAMLISKSFVVVKTDNSDASSWVSWETGFFDNKDADRIGVLLVEDDEKNFTHNTFIHQEYLKNYILLSKDDLLDFVKSGSKSIHEKRMSSVDSAFRNHNMAIGKTGALNLTTDQKGTTTKFYGSKD